MKEIKKPLFTKKSIVLLLLPIVAEQFLSVTIGLADTVMVAFAGEHAVSAISLVDSLNILLIQFLAAVATGGSVVAAQYLGGSKKEQASDTSKQLTQMILLFSLFITAVCAAFHTPLLSLIFGKVDADIMEGCEVYFLLSYLSYPFIGLYNAGAALFRAVKDTKTPLLISALMNLINIGGNAILIYGCRLGVAGAGIPSLLSRMVGAIVIFCLFQKKSNPIRISAPAKIRFDFPLIRRILGIGIPNGIEGALFHIGKIILSSLVSGLGKAAISANAIANAVASLSNIPGSAIGTGLITIVGQCMGAGQAQAAKKHTVRLLGVTYLCILFLNGLQFLFAPQLISLFSLSAESTEIAIKILRPFAVANLLLWPLAFELPYTLRAAGDVKFTMLVSMFSMWIFRIGCAFWFCKGLGFGVEATWVAMYVDWVCRATFFLFRFLSGKWQQKKVI